MTRTVRCALFATAALAACGGVCVADDRSRLTPAPQGNPSESSTFFHSYLAPRMTAKLSGSRPAVVAEFAIPHANPWTRAADTEDEVRRGAVKAAKSAVKRYALERLNLTGWSVPLGSAGQARGAAAFRTESGGARLRFGFSHRSPRAEVLLPVDKGRVSVSADLFGRIGTSFETPTGRLRVGAYVDPHDHTATAGLTVSF